MPRDIHGEGFFMGGPEDLMEFLEKLTGGRKGRGHKRDENVKVLRRVPMKKEWKEIDDRVKEIQKDVEQLMRKAKHLRQKFWVTVEEDLESHEDMHITDDRAFIEITEPGDED